MSLGTISLGNKRRPFFLQTFFHEVKYSGQVDLTNTEYKLLQESYTDRH